jgi:hypothetical protein
MERVGIAVALVAALAACGGEPVPSGPRPTKEAWVRLLLDLDAAMTRGDLDAAMTFMVPLPDADPEQVKNTLPVVTEREGFKRAAIEKLAARGRFSPLLELYPEEGKLWAAKAGVDPAACWALGIGGAQTAGHWDGQRFRLIWANDLFRLE